jgi:hypothetical protein
MSNDVYVWYPRCQTNSTFWPEENHGWPFPVRRNGRIDVFRQVKPTLLSGLRFTTMTCRSRCFDVVCERLKAGNKVADKRYYSRIRVPIHVVMLRVSGTTCLVAEAILSAVVDT